MLFCVEGAIGSLACSELSYPWDSMDLSHTKDPQCKAVLSRGGLATAGWLEDANIFESLRANSRTSQTN